MPMTSDEIIKLLEQNGFTYVGSRGSHRKYKLHGKGMPVMVPYHKGALPKGTEQSILRQAGPK